MNRYAFWRYLTKRTSYAGSIPVPGTTSSNYPTQDSREPVRLCVIAPAVLMLTPGANWLR